ncbi:MAG: AAA family ATPase [Myxococcales bacterium]|nr:AAA family ATPase [Myxococcales bacterium]
MASEVETELRRKIASGFPVVALETREEARALALVARLFPGREIDRWAATRAGAGAADDLVRVVLEALEDPTRVRVLLDVHRWLGEARVARALRDFVAGFESPAPPLVLLAPALELPVELERDVAVLALPLPSDAELSLALDGVIQEQPTPVLGEREPLLRAARGMTLLEAERAFRDASTAGSPTEAAARVGREKRRVLRSRATVELIDPDVDLDQVGGLGVLKSWLTQRVLAFSERARAFGLDEPRGMLVCGVQGCGKSLVSKAAASVLGLPLVRLDFAAVFASGTPELALRDGLFAVEAVAPVVLWVDEIEKGLGGDPGDARLGRTFGSFLTWLQERRAPVFVAATANEVDRLPPELARRGRFDEIFFVDLPSARDREEVLRVHLARHRREPTQFALGDLARRLDRFSGAELEQVVASALFRAFSAGRDLSQADLDAAAAEIIPLAVLYEERVQALRRWAETRARRASADRRTMELFEP